MVPLGTTVLAVNEGLADIQYFKATQDPDCSAQNPTTYTSGNRATDLVHHQWVCFKAKNTKGVYGYNELQLVLDQPSREYTLTLTQIGDTVTATGDDLSNHAYFTSATDPNCLSDNTTATWTAGTTAIDLNDKHWVCFKAQTPEQTTAYAELQVDLPTTIVPPASPLTLAQSNNTVTATGVNLTDFHYFTSQSRPDCSTDNTSATWTSGTSATGLLDQHWVCFKAQNAHQQTTYSQLQVDLTTPILTLTQADSAAVESAAGLTGHQHFTSSDDPTCDSTNASATWITTSNKTVADVANNHWVCMKAHNNLGVWGYAKVQVVVLGAQAQASTISLTQTISGSTATITATGTGLSSFQYFKTASPHANPNCSATNTTATWTSGKVATSLVNNQWVCFKAKNASNVYHYAELQADLTAPTITITQTGDTLSAATTATDLPTHAGLATQLPPNQQSYLQKPIFIYLDQRSNGQIRYLW